MLIYGLFSPRTAIQASVANSLCDVSRGNLCLPVVVGNSAGHAEDAVVGAGGKVEFGHSRLDEL